jgi:uncharacterized protein (DUF1800 family)
MAKVVPFKPSRSAPWDSRKAEHLLNRAGFGGTTEEVQALVRLGFDAAVDRVVQYDKVPDPLGPPSWLNQAVDLPAEFNPPRLRPSRPPTAPDAGVAQAPMPGAAMEALQPRERLRQMRQLLMRANRQRVEDLRVWWLDRMVRSPRPLEEKMTLFWHGHFATQSIKVRVPQVIYSHLELLRRHATGSFRELVMGISRDPAMLLYLDNHRSRKEQPNENYARELMELFTLGIGHYTEQDVKEAARAFTGWSMGYAGERSVRPMGPAMLLRLAAGDVKPTFLYRRAWHDDGEKLFMGSRGALDGEDIVRIILEKPACAEFISAKLVRFFVGEEQPRPELIAGLADVMRRHDYQLRPVLEALFRSRDFYRDDVMGNQIKSPVQLVVGAMRQLRAEVTPPTVLNLTLRQMGQVPLDPPNVGGWDGGKHWINTTTLLARYNFPLLLLEGRPPGAPGARPGGGGALRQGSLRRRIEAKLDLTPFCSPEALKAPGRLVDRLTEHLLSTPLSAAQRAELVEAAEKPAADDEARVKRLIHLIMSTPNYQVC